MPNDLNDPDVYDPVDADPNVPTRDFAYIEDLLLIRLKTAPKRGARTNKVRFIVQRDYASVWAEEELPGAPADDPRWRRVVVPRGYGTDFASVPPGLRWVVSQIGPWAEASVVHDYLCDAWKWQDGSWVFARRLWADRLMMIAMKRAEIGWPRHFIYAAITVYAYWLQFRYLAGFPPPTSTQRSDYIVDLDNYDDAP